MTRPLGRVVPKYLVGEQGGPSLGTAATLPRSYGSRAPSLCVDNGRDRAPPCPSALVDDPLWCYWPSSWMTRLPSSLISLTKSSGVIWPSIMDCQLGIKTSSAKREKPGQGVRNLAL